ncbi:Protein of unknown function [Gryllus bimaculatus]|nr:Protein of unknown function [Gryllus bimaculatus]
MLRSWRRDGRAIALGAALGVLVLVLVAAAAALLGAGPGPRPPRDPFASMRDVLRGSFIPRHFNATWLPGGHLYFLDEHEQPTLMKMKKQGDAVFAYNLISNESMQTIRKLVWAFAFIPSPDAKYILVKHDIHPVRHVPTSFEPTTRCP